MRDNPVAATSHFAIFVMVCGIRTFGLFMVFAQLRFQTEVTCNADFTNVSGLKNGDFVRIAGVEVGKVQHISIRPDTPALASPNTRHQICAKRFRPIISDPRSSPITLGVAALPAHNRHGQHSPAQTTFDSDVGGLLFARPSLSRHYRRSQ